jgi:anti-sigma factor RsiW
VNEFHSGVPVTEHPSAEDIAAYLSGRLAQASSEALEQHLVECAECRQVVTSARRVLRTHRAPRLVWVVPSAAAAMLLIAILIQVPGSTVGDEPLRSDSGAAGSESALTIPVVAPRDGEVVSSGSIVFVWRAQNGGPLYRLSLTEASGRQMWSGETTDTTLSMPADVPLDRGQAYFWTVDALGADGRSLTTRSKRFSIAP